MQKSPFSLSVVTITFNNFKELVATIESVKKLKAIIPDLELVIINGGSCEETARYLQNDFGQFENSISVSESDKGIADAFNKGVLKASKKWLTFINSGDLVNEDFKYFNQLIETLSKKDESDEIVLFHGDILYGKTSNYRLIKGNRSLPLMPYFHPGMIVQRSLFEENHIGLFNLDYRIAMDFEWLCRILKDPIFSKKTYYIPFAAIKMDNSGTSSKNVQQSLDEVSRALSFYSLLNLSLKLKIFYHRLRNYIRRGLSAIFLKKQKRE